jgi:hypothetical protein
MDPKDRYTMMFLRAANQLHDSDSIKKVRTLWWYSTRDKEQGGLRLTDLGLQFIVEQADIKVYQIKLPKELTLTSQVIIWLDQFIDSPFHINKKEITVMSEKAAFELYLFSGDVRKMGHAKAMSKRLSQNLESN